MAESGERMERRGRLPVEWGRRWTRDDLLRLQVMLNAGYGVHDIDMLLSRAIESFVLRETVETIRLPERRSQAGRGATRP